jgi:hypothetical protein
MRIWDLVLNILAMQLHNFFVKCLQNLDVTDCPSFGIGIGPNSFN